MTLQPMLKNVNDYFVISKTPFIKNVELSKEDLDTCFEFAWQMSFGEQGAFRQIRSGGSEKRKMGKRFINAFDGKISEFGVYNWFKQRGFDINYPDISVHGLGVWDDGDFIINNKRISVKATRQIGNLLLLETRDWDEQGRFKFDVDKNGGVFDYFIFVRYSSTSQKSKESKDILKADSIDKEYLREFVMKQKYEINVVGYISHKEFVEEVIGQKHIIYKGAMLNGTTPMDATNYYVQSGDLHPIDTYKG